MKLTVEGNTLDVDKKEDAVSVNGKEFTIKTQNRGPVTTVMVDGRPYQVELQQVDDATFRATVDGKVYEVQAEGLNRPAQRHKAAESKHHHVHDASGAVRALMPGMIVKILVKAGDEVEPGTVLLTLEAMKMENEIRAPVGGTVKSIEVKPGNTVNAGDVLAVIE